MSLDVWAPMLKSNLSFCKKACLFATKLHILNFCEDVRGYVAGYAVTEINGNRKRSIPKNFWSSGKAELDYEIVCNNNVQKVVVSDSIPDALRDLHTSK